MNLRDAFAGLGAPEPKRLGAQVPKRSSSEAERNGAGRQSARERGPAPLSLQGTAKSRHPEFEAVKVYLRRNTHKLARRKCEDNGDGDFSDLVESLLQQYLGA
jgi:hypothetical protein